MRTLSLFWIFIVGLTLIFSSCKTIRIEKNSKKVLTISQIYDSIQSSKLEYESLNAKFSVKYTTKSKSLSLKGNVRILKDSLIWVSLSPGLGIEAVRMMCTRDSIFLLDRINKSLTKGKYDYLNKLWKIDVDYNSLQSIITNQFFIYPVATNEKDEFIKNFSIRNDSSNISLYRKTPQSVENLVKFPIRSFIMNEYLLNDVPNLRSLNVNYTTGSFEGINYFPEVVDISSTNSGKNIQVTLNYTKVTLNESLNFSFSVPSSYRLIVH